MTRQFTRKLYRGPDPLLRVDQMTTYGLYRPLQTHYRRASCEESGCPLWGTGFPITVPADGDQERLLRQAIAGRVDGVKRPGGVRHPHPEIPGHVRWDFPAGTPCLKRTRHRVPLERPAIAVQRGGDWRGATGERRTFAAESEWAESFAEHQDRLAHLIGGRP